MAYQTIRHELDDGVATITLSRPEVHNAMNEPMQLGLTEINLAIIPGGGGTQRLPRLVGRGKALEMILTGARLPAAEALRIGLVERVVPAAGVLKAARELAGTMAAKAPVALRYAK